MKRFRRVKEGCIYAALFICAFVSVLTTFAIIVVLFRESVPFFEVVSIRDFLFGKLWTPLFEPKHFGVLPLVCGTFLVAAGAALVSIPLGVSTAIYLSEYASSASRRFLKPILEILAGIPTVVYGYFALTFVTPILKYFVPQTQIFNAASAAIVIGIMTLPMVASLCDDAMRAVPKALRYAAFALGSTPAEVSLRVVFPAAFSGVMASFILAISRAIGETMIVMLAAGSTPKLTLNPFESIQTMTAYIAQISTGDTPTGTIEYQTLFVVGLALFLMTFLMNIFGISILRRFQERYE